jgi:hypothetical protein
MLKLTNDAATPPLVEMDYTFVEQLKILNLTWTNESVSAAIVVPSKGPEKYPVAWILKRMQKWGLQAVRLRTDAEASIMALAKAVATSNEQKVLIEVAPVQSHQSMGHVERAHRLLQEQLRVNRFELEEHLKQKLELTVALGSWMVRHASWQLFRFLVHSERHNTGFERVHGRVYGGALVPFGETVLARVHDDPSLGFHRYSKWEGRWQFGVWLGKSEMTDEHLVACNDGVKKFRTVRKVA